MTPPDVTVVIATYNGADRILPTLNRLRRQSAADRMSLLVVDDGSTDDTAELCRRAGFDVVVHATNMGVGAARETGLQHATTRFVAYTDDDCEFGDDWLDRLLAAADRHPDAGAWGGYTVPTATPGPLGDYMARTRPWGPLEKDVLDQDSLGRRFVKYVRRSFSPPAERVDEREVASLVTSNLLLDRAAAQNVGGFDPRFRYGGEEEELFRRMAKSGYRLIFVPDAVVEHEFEPRLPDILRRNRAYGRGNARMFLKHEDMTPTLYPFPGLAAAAVGLALLRPRWLPFALLTPLTLYPRWPFEAIREKNVRPGGYAYIQLLQEGACDLGWLDVLIRERDQFGPEIAARLRQAAPRGKA